MRSTEGRVRFTVLNRVVRIELWRRKDLSKKCEGGERGGDI